MSLVTKISSWKQPQLLARRFLSTSTENIYTPILIVGAGPSGLMMSNLLSSYKTPSIVLEASSSTTRHPQAHFLNTRTMEILRHALPNIYAKIQDEMPPVEHWKSFLFGHDMCNTMAHVVHPVDRPLQANQDANGTLVDFAKSDTPSQSNDAPLSSCCVGHLPQHVFCHILQEEATSPVYYNTSVTNVEYNSNDGMHTVHTKEGTTFTSRVLVAADGAHSQLRKQWEIDMQGQTAIQHLVNVYIRASSFQRMEPAMLYCIWNPHFVGMMVRHSEDEYVLQIPYFPPYQTMEDNFSLEKVTQMVQAAFDHENFEIVSIRPWTMSSLVAQHYVSKNGSGVLVGDAAHVFPPAGGLGMNTGLQDVFCLAWRLSYWYANGEDVAPLLQAYEKERRPIAQQNAALSVRNYNRILNLTKACYLNEQHPAALIKMLDQATMIPLSARQSMFQTALETALWPLSALKDSSHFHTKHVTSRVKRILKQGQGLPLLFPKHELGFGYNDKDAAPPEDEGDWKEDTMGYTPTIKVGYLLPHVELCVENYSMELYPNMQPLHEKDGMVHITSSDLPSQVRVGGPCFVLLVLNSDDEQCIDVIQSVKTRANVEIRTVKVVYDDSVGSTDSFNLVVRDEQRKLCSRADYVTGPTMTLIRPDGHVASAVCLSTAVEVDDKSEFVRADAPDVLIKGLYDVLGTTIPETK